MSNDLNLTKEKLLRFLDRLGASARSPGTCYITGGGSALLLGWRETTIDIDLLDVTEMLRRKLVTPKGLLLHAEAIRPEIKRYPAVDEESFVRRVKEFLGGLKDV